MKITIIKIYSLLSRIQTIHVGKSEKKGENNVENFEYGFFLRKNPFITSIN
jgi:hypothetical protein